MDKYKPHHHAGKKLTLTEQRERSGYFVSLTAAISLVAERAKKEQQELSRVRPTPKKYGIKPNRRDI